MITFSKLGKYGMNLGNQLHQIASMIGFSEKYGCDLVLPEWKYAPYFPYAPDQGIIETDISIDHQEYHYLPEFWDSYAEVFRTKNVDIFGWLQTEKYWIHAREKVLHSFSFEDRFKDGIKSQFRSALAKKTIAISIRRGDFVTDPNFYLLPLEFYLAALVEYFPRYDEYNILVFSDDIRFCRTYIKPLGNIFFAKGLNDVEQLCLMSLCDHFIISNSTFSWWGAMLGEKAASVVIRSPYHLQGELLKKFDTKDYYPERWISFEHVGKEMTASPLLAQKRHLQYFALQNYCHKKVRKIKRKIKTYI